MTHRVCPNVTLGKVASRLDGRLRSLPLSSSNGSDSPELSVTWQWKRWALTHNAGYGSLVLTRKESICWTSFGPKTVTCYDKLCYFSCWKPVRRSAEGQSDPEGCGKKSDGVWSQEVELMERSQGWNEASVVGRRSTAQTQTQCSSFTRVAEILINRSIITHRTTLSRPWLCSHESSRTNSLKKTIISTISGLKRGEEGVLTFSFRKRNHIFKNIFGQKLWWHPRYI